MNEILAGLGGALVVSFASLCILGLLLWACMVFSDDDEKEPEEVLCDDGCPNWDLREDDWYETSESEEVYSGEEPLISVSVWSYPDGDPCPDTEVPTVRTGA